MDSLLLTGLEAYVYEHTSAEASLFARLQEETYASLELPQMQVGRVEAQFLRMLVQMSAACRVLEIGTFSGYSALALASGLPEDGRLITCDIDPVATGLAQKYFTESPWGDQIELRLGPALETMQALKRDGAAFDLVFIDADKESYIDYWEAGLALVPAGGLVVVDNTLWSGKVLNPQDESDHAIVKFNAHVKQDARVEHVLLSVRDGMMLARKKP